MKQTVVITGASRGIGRAVALAFAEKNASKNNHEEYNIFVNCAKNSELLENVKKQIRDLGVCCESFTGDISDYNTAMEMLMRFTGILVMLIFLLIMPVFLLSDCFRI